MEYVKYTIVVWFSRGMRVYEVTSTSPQGAIEKAMYQDFKDYPDNPSDFSQVEVMRGHNLTCYRK